MARYEVSKTAYTANGMQAFTDALANIAADGGGYLEVTDPGVYEIDTLYLPANTVLTVGAGVTLKRVNGNYMVRNSSDGCSNYGAPGNIHVQGRGTLDVNSHHFTESYGASGITFIQCDNVSVEGVTITGVRNWHAVEYQSVRNGTIRDVTATGFTASSPGWWAGEAFQLDLNKEDWSPCQNILVDGCTSIRYGKLLGSHASRKGKAHADIRVIGNYAQGCHHYAVGGENWNRVTVTGNNFVSCNGGVQMRIPALDDAGVAFTSHNKGFTITGNNFVASGAQNQYSAKMPAAVDIVSESSARNYGITVGDNNFSGSNQYGVHTVNAGHVSVTDNNTWDGFSVPSLIE